ncbi:phospholipase D-like domain-containing protein [Pseudomonas fragariae (ex Marin et al. 2024)]|uniref:Phospholipase D-like domain-containing protein n=2 Tax=Pseudomonas TaxID=286 RepID=A0A3M5WU25_9PSED|nr:MULTISPECIES: phospholipase D-like domain-containing protein [Pseudomonas]AKF45253.1 PLD-like domain protein [Pseudomonas syringae pv. syringae B301D]EXL31617.1 hypothetical protein PssB301D_02295 [Pseudomonas syringae pv. syringae str. B301D-R]MDV0428555.1 phospholipase D-like domain-containing protein [Pseudomonas sp. 17]MDX9573415.1 phospholipase D-like domain-containing protein [Pseudomonas sp. 21(2023)]MDX9587455.1 phospholipase D-like domain-containing protein [Pseudomonas sp. 19(2023
MDIRSAPSNHATAVPAAQPSAPSIKSTLNKLFRAQCSAPVPPLSSSSTERIAPTRVPANYSAVVDISKTANHLKGNAGTEEKNSFSWLKNKLSTVSLNQQKKQAIQNFIAQASHQYNVDEDVAKLAVAASGVYRQPRFEETQQQRVHACLQNTEALTAMIDLAARKPLTYKMVMGLDSSDCSFDPVARISDHDILTEAEQCQVVRSAFASADKVCVVTSYGIKPLGAPKSDALSPTIASVLQGFASKQHDKDFTGVFFYQKSDAIQNYYTEDKRTNISIKENDWAKVVTLFNAAVERGELEGPKLENIQANLFFLAGEPKGFAGSHHDKFIVNDNGLCVTMGASLGNIAKPNWMDSGCVTLSNSLASEQLTNFLDNQSETAIKGSLFNKRENHCAKLDNLEGRVVQRAAIESRDIYSALMPIVVENAGKKLNAINTTNGTAQEQFFKDIFNAQGFDLGHSKKKSIAWIKNKGSNDTSGGFERPIGKALKTMLTNVAPGEKVCIRNGSSRRFDEGVCKLLANAAQKGAKLQILTSLADGFNQINYLREQILKNLKGSEADKQSALANIDVRIFNRESHLVDIGEQRGWPSRFEDKGFKDHGKLFGVLKADGNAEVMTGTYNLDSQSVRRSFENMQVIDDKDGSFLHAGFSQYFASDNPPINFGTQSPEKIRQTIEGMWKK